MAVNTFERELYDAMSQETPVKQYIKTILGKVYVTTLNPFDGKPQAVELYGEPVPHNAKAIIKIWSTKEDLFFKQMNAEHFRAGNLKELDIAKTPAPPKSPNEISDEEIIDVLNKPFLALKNQLNKFTKVAPVYRFLRAAEELEKSEKILDAIRARMSELELGIVEGQEEE